MKNLPSIEELHQYLRCEPETGDLYWLPRVLSNKRSNSWNRKFAGKKAPSVNIHGYKKLAINGQTILQHRIVWAMYYGEWPATDIDHINLCKTDNRINNLRLATRAQNSQNKRLYKTNTSGRKGVTFCKREQRWHTKIGSHNKQYHIGYYNNLEEAANAYDKAAISMNGTFARTNKMSLK